MVAYFSYVGFSATQKTGQKTRNVVQFIEFAILKCLNRLKGRQRGSDILILGVQILLALGLFLELVDCREIDRAEPLNLAPDRVELLGPIFECGVLGKLGSDRIALESGLTELLANRIGADFDLDTFSHLAEYNREEGRIELRLVSSEPQEVSIGDEEIEIDENEAILTEYSHKYTLEGFARMAGEAGFDVAHVWTDDDELFSVQYCTVGVGPS